MGAAVGIHCEGESLEGKSLLDLREDAADVFRGSGWQKGDRGTVRIEQYDSDVWIPAVFQGICVGLDVDDEIPLGEVFAY